MIIFAENFRGFRNIEIDTSKCVFLVGDNSSGKSSLLYLIDAIHLNDLNEAPQLDEEFGVDRFDYFSPYFDNADVTFGFVEKNSSGKKIGKIITVRKDGRIPKILSCSYFIDEQSVTIKKLKSGAQAKISNEKHNFDTRRMIKIHKARGKFYKLKGFERQSVSEVPALFIALPSENGKLHSLIRQILSLRIKKCTLISPIRAMPERFYSFRLRFDSRGSHFAAMIMDVSSVNNQAFELINKFGKESNLFDKLEVKKTTDEIEYPPLIVTIEKNNKNFLMNQVGIGVSQIVPILIEAYASVSINKKNILIMQPELHLHPVAQAALGTYLHAMAQFGLRGVFETHSSFLIDRFRSEVRNSTSDKPVEAEIIFCQNQEVGNKAYHIPIEPDGRMLNEPIEYHQFFVDEFVRTTF
jgi:predicted ATPase